jgi:putative ABC transport system permease protein
VNRYDYSANEMMITLKDGADPILVKNTIKEAGYDKFAKIQTALDAEPQFVKDMRDTFAMLGNIISSIGLVVAAITVFIVIFINAITRRKFIGIMKGIGISNFAIEVSYIIQSVFYAICGITLGALIVFLLLKPFFATHPIDYPFGDGILVAEQMGTFIRAMILLVATIVAGYIPARIVVKQNTLDSILGR